MSRIEEALRRASTGTSASDVATPHRDRFMIAAKPRPRVEDFVAENPVTPPAIAAAPSAPVVEPQARRTQAPAAPVVPSPGPTLGHVPESVEGKLVSLKGTDPTSVEQYRRLATSLHGLQRQHGIKVLMVTSSVPREGKTLTSTNLALTLSESYSRRVLLIDGDLRRPFVHEVFGLPNTVGLGDGLRTPGTTLTLVNATANLTVLTAGPPDSNPMAGLASERMRAVLKEASERFDWVILDTPPVGLISDASLMAGFVDGVVFVIGAGSTNYQLIERAITEIGRERIIGTVLNRVEPDNGGYYHHYYEGATGDDE